MIPQVQPEVGSMSLDPMPYPSDEIDFRHTILSLPPETLPALLLQPLHRCYYKP